VIHIARARVVNRDRIRGRVVTKRAPVIQAKGEVVPIWRPALARAMALLVNATPETRAARLERYVFLAIQAAEADGGYHDYERTE
jgi:hypothetical protein